MKEVNLVEDNRAGGGRGLDYVMFRDICYLEPWLRLAKHVAVASHAARFGLYNHPTPNIN
jgi:hypothetical protein